jgi:hypothetical protein
MPTTLDRTWLCDPPTKSADGMVGRPAHAACPGHVTRRVFVGFGANPKHETVDCGCTCHLCVVCGVKRRAFGDKCEFCVGSQS